MSSLAPSPRRILTSLFTVALLSVARAGAGFASTPAVVITPSWAAAAAGENLARDARISVSERPHYPAEREGWRGRLNDGQTALVDRRMWTSSAAVGWREVDHVVVEIDLGAVRSVGRVAMRVLGGGPQVHLVYPRAITVWLSEDGERWLQAQQAFRERDFPAERGEANVANVVLELRGRARFVALHFELGVNFLFLDEIAVMRDVGGAVPLVNAPTRLSPLHRGVVAFPDKREWVISDPPLPTFLTILQNGSRLAPREMSALIDAPDSVELRGADALGATPNWPGHRRYRLRISHPHASMAHVSRPLFMIASDPLPVDASVRITPLARGGRTLEFPLRSIRIPVVAAPRTLHVSLAWLQANLLPDWPDLVPTLTKLGFNAVGVFPQYWPKGRPLDVEQRLLAAARGAKMSVIYIDSPFHVMEERNPSDRTYRTQLEGGAAGPGVSPCYRGRLYREELSRIEMLARTLRPQWVFFDSELWARGTADVEVDQHCAALRVRGLSGSALRVRLGGEIAADLRSALDRALPGSARPRTGLYAVDPTRPYQGLFDFSAMFPGAIDLAMPSLYVGGDPLAVHENIRAIRKREPRAFILPWLTAGAQGEFSSDRMRGIALEAFFSGARGITYYLAEDFDSPEDFRAHAEAIALVSRYEPFFSGGAHLESLRSSNADITISGRALLGRRLVLAGNYRSRRTESGVIATGCAGPIRNAETGAPLSAARGAARVELPPGASVVLTCEESAKAEGP